MKTDTQELEAIREQERTARALLLELARKRREIMRRLWNDGKGMTLQAIADIYGVKSRERVRQIIETGNK